MAVSIITPCFNHGKYLDECVNSVINQTFKDWEIIIVDDCSTDTDTKNIIKKQTEKSSNIRYIFSEKNYGPGKSRNIGIQNSKYDLIVTLDADNILRSNYLERMVSELLAGKGDFIYCSFHRFGCGTDDILKLQDYSFDKLLHSNYIDTCSLFQKKHWKQVGGWDEIIIGWEDWEFWVSLGEIGCKGYRIPEVLFDYRICHNSALTNIRTRHAEYIARMRKKHPNLKRLGV